jgi:hypothetical protein
MDIKTVEIVDDLGKINCPEHLGYNQRTLYSVILKKDIIITKDDADGRRFGGAFVKMAIKGNDIHTWVTSTLSEEDFKVFLEEQFKVDKNTLYQYN